MSLTDAFGLGWGLKMRVMEKWIFDNLQTEKLGLEISPLFRPATDKKVHNVHYTDYTTTQDNISKHAHYDHPEIVEIDFVWTPGRQLKECAPTNNNYEWAIASHVLEHVPDPVGWMLEVFAVLNVGGILSLALPDRNKCFDRNRNLTEVSEWIHAWLDEDKRPNSRQLYDFLSNVTTEDGSGTVLDKNHYSKEEALNFTLNSHSTGQYFDAHCSVFTGHSFTEMINELNYLGIMNVKVSEFKEGFDEFYVQLTKVGEPKINRPDAYLNNAMDIYNLEKDLQANIENLEHHKKAYREAIVAQNLLKSEISRLKNRNLIKRILNR